MTFGVYVHIPYCVGRRIPEKEYTEAVLREIDSYKESIEKLPLHSIFFGGGTPSLFSADSIGKIISKILETTLPLDSIEVSLEVNPKTADLEKLKALKDVGVN